MLRSQAALCRSTGSFEMLVFQMLLAGKSGQFGAPGTTVPSLAGRASALPGLRRAAFAAPALALGLAPGVLLAASGRFAAAELPAGTRPAGGPAAAAILTAVPLLAAALLPQAAVTARTAAVASPADARSARERSPKEFVT